MTRHDARPAGLVLRIRLDPTVSWEALLARHLEGLSAARRPSRARELLVAGFREECWVRSQLANRPSSGWPRRQEGSKYVELPTKISGEGIVAGPAPTSKPLSALAKVIG